jgi:hypothetical protein
MWSRSEQNRVIVEFEPAKHPSVEPSIIQVSTPYLEAKNGVITNSSTRQRLLGPTEITASTGFIFGVEDMIRLASLPIELRGTDSKLSFIIVSLLSDLFASWTFDWRCMHCIVLHTYSPLMCTIVFETGWLKFALEDSALFNSTIYYWALLNHPLLPEKC